MKGERSYSPKSATVKRMYPPGVHGKAFRRRGSEYGAQLQSKQKIRNVYRMLERQFKNLAKTAIKSKKETSDTLVKSLENRLDNVVFRAGLAQSRDQARQVVNHGHVLVNKRKVSIPSFRVKMGDSIAVREGSLRGKYFSSLVPQWIQKHEPPKWIKLDKEKLNVEVVGLPTLEESGLESKDIQALIEFYSR